MISLELRNILAGSFSLMLQVAAITPAVALQAIILADSKQLPASVAFYCEGIGYSGSLIFAWFSPTVISTIGHRNSLTLSALILIPSFMSMMWLKQWSIYLGAVLSSISGSISWVVVPAITVYYSTPENVQSNLSLNWMILMFSGFPGNLADYFFIGGLKRIDTPTRIIIYSTCCILSVVSMAVSQFGVSGSGRSDVAVVPSEMPDDEDNDEDVISEEPDQRQRHWILEYLHNRDVWCVLMMIISNGVTLSLLSMTLTTCLANTFPERKIISLNIMFMALGEIGGAFAIRQLEPSIRNSTFILFAFFVVTCANFMAFLMLDSRSNTMDTIGDFRGYLTPNIYFFHFNSFLYGYIDNTYNILTNVYIAKVFKNHVPVGYTVAIVIGGLVTGLMFFTNGVFSIHIQIAALQGLVFLSSMVVILKLSKLD